MRKFFSTLIYLVCFSCLLHAETYFLLSPEDVVAMSDGTFKVNYGNNSTYSITGNWPKLCLDQTKVDSSTIGQDLYYQFSVSKNCIEQIKKIKKNKSEKIEYGSIKDIPFDLKTLRPGSIVFLTKVRSFNIMSKDQDGPCVISNELDKNTSDLKAALNECISPSVGGNKESFSENNKDTNSPLDYERCTTYSGVFVIAGKGYCYAEDLVSIKLKHKVPNSAVYMGIQYEMSNLSNTLKGTEGLLNNSGAQVFLGIEN